MERSKIETSCRVRNVTHSSDARPLRWPLALHLFVEKEYKNRICTRIIRENKGKIWKQWKNKAVLINRVNH